MKTLSTLCLFLLVVRASATHFVGGYIQAKPVSGLQYEIKVIVYFNEATGAEASRQASEIKVCTGDGATLTLARTVVKRLDSSTSQNEYQTTYTYAGPGVYLLTAWQENRTVANNLANADSQIFSVATRLSIQNGKTNRTPIINLPPDAFSAFVNQQAKISLAATDEDNDSLSFSLTKPLTSLKNNFCNALIASGYVYPNELSRQGTFKVDSREGVVTWNAPTAAGRYTFAVKVLEWRSGVLIGETSLDLTIGVSDRAGTGNPIPPYEPVIENSLTGQLVLGFDDASISGLTLATFPNPATDYFRATLFTRTPTRASLQLLNPSGQVIQETKAGLQQSRYEETFNINQLPAGVYFLRAEADGKVLVRKVVKQ